MKAPDKHITITFSPTLLFFLLIVTMLSFSVINAQSNPEKNRLDHQDNNTYVITKTTSIQKLDSIVESLKAIGFVLEYKNLYYNNSGQITSLSLIYKDRNLNSGQYAVSSEQPINDIVISIAENRIAIRSQGKGNSMSSSQSQNNNAAIYEQKLSEVADRRAQRHKSMESRRKQAEQKRKHRLSQAEARREQIHKDYVDGTSKDISLEYRTITMNSSDGELVNLKKLYADEGIYFSCHDVKRNSNNEIVHIYITIDNGHGTTSSTGFGNGKNPINDIRLGVNSNSVIVRNNNQ